ncbi:MAG: methionyl-tRNA formyltransferase [Clostridia bacterium]|nr:methionyl-tRNA formyltransferase [Clostridia bacterium]
MAQIDLNNIKKIEKNRNFIHDKVYTTYTVFSDLGDKYFQLDTYGRIDRENPEKISQSIQLDRDTAKFLVNLLIKEFDLK